MRIYRTGISSRNTKEMLVGSLILISTVLSTNGLPYSPQIKAPYTEFQNSAQSRIITSPEQEVIFQAPEQQQVVIFQPEQQDALFQSPEQQPEAFFQGGQQDALFESLEQQQVIPKNFGQTDEEVQPNVDYFTSGGSTSVGQGTDFTFSCTGSNRICTSKNECVNGYVSLTKSYSPRAEAKECRVYDQVCCTIAEGFEEESISSSQNVEASKSPSAFAAPTHVQLQCAAALLCVEEQFCTMDGTISPQPVAFTAKQLLRRVPLSSCKNPESGIIGKCCRDPNYVDPWPTGNLPANYTGGFDNQGFPSFLNIARVKPKTQTDVKHRPTQQQLMKVEQKLEPTLVPENSDISTKTLILPSKDKDVKSDFNRIEQKLRCGVRNRVVQQPEAEESRTVFAEIPWQAMVLHSQERKILCSGVLLGSQDVLTAANCVDSFLPNDVSIKLGEWKLGYELKQEEPLPFQIINVSSINIHPGYTRGLGEHDLAMLHLEKPVTFDYHISPLCLPESKYLVQNNELCITTGWGKSILQAHYAGAIMHAVRMNVLPTERCKEQLIRSNFEAEIAEGTICAAPKEEQNNVCETDVGGPLACQNEHGSYELMGIYSQDTGCLPTNQVAMFAPLDATWLKGSIIKSTPEESKLDVVYAKQLSSDDYRKSNLAANNQYLPPN